MVLTRSSYSRLGTPLASPLSNPNKPLAGTTTQTNHRRAKRLSLSSTTSTNNTNLPLTPMTQVHQFGLELIDRLNQQNNVSSEAEDSDERLARLLQKAREKARLVESKSMFVGGAGSTDRLAGSPTSDCGSSVTLQNVLRFDDHEALKIALHRPLRPTTLPHPPASSSHLPTSNPSMPAPDNFARLATLQDQKLGLTARHSSKKLDWHDLPVQELTRETKMEIQAMRLHRTLDPKSFVKGGIEKSLKEPIPSKFLFGHIVDGSTAALTSSSSKKRTFVESLVDDHQGLDWIKHKYRDVIHDGKRNSGGKNFYKKLKENRAR